MFFSRLITIQIEFMKQPYFLHGYGRSADDLLMLIALILFLSGLSYGQVSVVTQHNNNARTGLNPYEKELTVANVRKDKFGKIGVFPVDDQIYAQPLIVSGLEMPGEGKKNVLFIGTVNNTLYAFDAEDLSGARCFWKKRLIPPGERPVRNTDLSDACNGNYKDFSGNIGIVGTPVIDTIRNTLYVVTKSMENETECHQRLHAINLLDGSERDNSPALIEGFVIGTGSGSENDTIAFRAMTQNQRAALLLANGYIYVAWAGHCDSGPFHGWVMAFDPITLKRKYIYNDTRNGHGAGIWMSGQGPSCDNNGYVYVTCGNGTYGLNGNTKDSSNLGDSFIKLTPGLTVCDWFTPYNYPLLDDQDLDLGSAGILLFPNSNLVISGGKEGVLYVVDKEKMGRLNSAQNDNQIVQSFLLNRKPNNLHGSPVYYHGPDGEYLYVWAEYDHCRSFKFDRANGKFFLPSASQSLMAAPDGMPGAMISISSNGTLPGTGIIWASHPFSGNANWETRPGILRALDATDLSHELWNTKLDSLRDDFGNFAKFCYPTIANGKVYLATFSNQLVVYGLFDKVSAVSDAEGASDIMLSPVPVSDYLDIHFAKEDGEAEIILSDINADEVMRRKENVVNGSLRIYTGDLTPGVYFVTIRCGDKQTVKRIAVIR